MTIIYEYDADGYATGESKEQSDKSPIPPGWTIEKPTGAEGERFVGNVWQVVPLTAPQIPESVPALSGLLALDNAGLSADYDAWAKDPARTFAERAFIDKAMTWRRDDPVIASSAEPLGLSDDDVDQLFIAASEI